MDKTSTRLILLNQIEIMRALAVLAAKVECQSTVHLLSASAHATAEHVATLRQER